MFSCGFCEVVYEHLFLLYSSGGCFLINGDKFQQKILSRKSRIYDLEYHVTSTHALCLSVVSSFL